jgi:hypothetical protein
MSAFTGLLRLLGLIEAAAPLLPPPLPVAWMGIDRSDIPKSAGSADTNWLGLLIDNSNLRLCGAYLEGTTFPAPGTADQFTNSTQAVARDWVPANVSTMRGQGWGTMFYYVGYSVGGGEPLPSTAKLALADYPARGQLHARHAKTIVSTITPALDGAVVFFDNEDSEDTNISALIPYYNAFFDELQTPGPGALPALRPGLYAHNKIAMQFLSERPQLFTLEVNLDTSTTTTTQAPFTAADNPLVVAPAKRELHPMTVTSATQKWIAWPVARQFRYFVGNMPATGSTLAKIVGFTPVITWDYDSAVVRDPAYPNAEPRLTFAIDPVGPAIVRGVFVPRSSADPPQMSIDMVDALTPLSTSLPASKFVEPDAPIAQASFTAANESKLASILQGGSICVCDAFVRSWSDTNSSATIAPRPLRALAYAAFAADDLQVFFIGNDRSLYGIRSLAGGAWSAPARMGAPLVVHPFGMLAAASRAATTVDVFTINDAGLLSTAWWSPADPTWPAGNLQPLELAPSAFFSHTAIAAVSAAANKLHVFGVGADRRLRYVEFTDTTWGAVTALGSADQVVSPHTRIAAYAPSATRVEVAVLSDAGNVRVHAIANSGAASAAWSEVTPPTELYSPDPAAPAGYVPPDPSALTEPAYGWRINPYGDLAIGAVNGNTMVFAAGVSPGATAALRRSLAAGGVWERYR